MSLSERQQDILNFIQDYVRENHIPPTIREIGEHAGISSTSVVKYNLEKLAEKGLIERGRHVSRGLRVVQGAAGRSEMVQVPLMGYIAAGEPLQIPESATDFALLGGETVPVDPGLLKSTQDVYALRVKGDSMIDALISDGDIVIIKYQREAQNGDTVAAWLRDEQSVTLKKFYHEGRRVRLQPANPTMEPMYFPPESIDIRGKVVLVIRQLD